MQALRGFESHPLRQLSTAIWCFGERVIPAVIRRIVSTTDAGLVPIVAIGGVTVRAYVDPPEDPSAPSMEWTLAALEALGDAAIERIDPAASGPDRISGLRNALESIPEHEKLHQALAAALRAAAG